MPVKSASNGTGSHLPAESERHFVELVDVFASLEDGSAINGCGLCIEAHEQELRKAGIGKEAIQAAVRSTSVVHAVGVVLESEAQGPTAQADAA